MSKIAVTVTVVIVERRADPDRWRELVELLLTLAAERGSRTLGEPSAARR